MEVSLLLAAVLVFTSCAVALILALRDKMTDAIGVGFMMALIEDQVLDKAAEILGLGSFDTSKDKAKSGTGQATTLSSLGFKGHGSKGKPDGWYLPEDTSKPALLLEAKAGDKDVTDPEYLEQLNKYLVTVGKRYPEVIGIVYNGTDTFARRDRL